MAINTKYPTTKPSLLLDFANSKSLDPRVTFGRASTATYYDGKTYSNGIPVLVTASAGVPRFDHNPVTGESLGLLVEDQRTNLLTYSDQFDNAAWTKARTVITANATTSPDGTLSADKIVDDATASTTHYIYSPVSVVSGTTYTYSLYVKAAERSTCALSFYNTNGAFASATAYFDVNTGIVSKESGITSAGIINVGGGWYRIWATQTALASASGSIAIHLTNAGAVTYTGDGVSGLYIWGAQLEAGATQSSYIPTTTAQATRITDSVSIAGANFNLIRKDEGTVFVMFKTDYDLASNTIFATDGAVIGNDTVKIRCNSGGNLYGTVYYGGAAQYTSALTSISSNATYKAAIGYKTNSFAFSVNGSISSGATGTVPSAGTTAYIGNYVSDESINGRIAKVAIYTSRLTDSQIQALTA